MTTRPQKGPEFQTIAANEQLAAGCVVLVRGPGHYGFGRTLAKAYAQARRAGMLSRDPWYAVLAPVDAAIDDEGTVSWISHPAFQDGLTWVATAKRHPGPPHECALPGGGDPLHVPPARRPSTP